MNKDNTKKIVRRTTVQRMAVFEELKKMLTHPTADELYIKVKHKLSGVSLSTVYRNLEILCEEGLIKRLQFSSGQTRYDATLSIHYHIRCIECGRVGDIDFEQTRRIIELANKRSDYEVLDCKLEFIGICPKCQKNEKIIEKEIDAEKIEI
ncbi:MAG: transcriptional repressor [Caldisericales bacterium]|nr:transcriptional repressor [bacterium]